MPSSRLVTGAQSVTRALDVLACFTTDRFDWGVTEIAEYLGMHKSAAHRFLKALEQGNLVEQTAEHRYRLGIRSLELGAVFTFQTRILHLAEPPMRALAASNGFSVHLAQSSDRCAFELMKIPGESASGRTQSRILRKPAHASALGKVLLAYSGPAAIDRYIGLRKRLDRFTEYTICKPDEFREHMAAVARDGYAVDLEECQKGRYCLAAPIRNQKNQVVAAISFSNSAVIFDESNRSRYLLQLTTAAQEIQKRL